MLDGQDIRVEKAKIYPFIKWAGGKRWLAEVIRNLAPRNFQTYYEPFFGGGAVFFHMQPERAILSDMNSDLISCYKSVRRAPYKISQRLSEYQEKHCPEFYYAMRQRSFVSSLDRASQFIYLNRTCFNGLYRVNKNGQFNVPIGTKTSVELPSDNFPLIAKALKGKDILCCDFEETLRKAGEGDFVFCDPPYTVKHNKNGFIKYNEKIFSWADQVRLRNCVAKAKERGAKIVVTNANHESVRELYADISQEISVERFSVMSGSAAKRGRYEESVFVC